MFSTAQVPLVIFIALVVFLAVGLQLNPNEKESALIGKPAPTFSLPQLQNPQATISNQDLIGKVSLVNAWASWCVSCRYEHPLLMQVSKQYKDIQILGLNYKDTVTAAQRTLQRQGNPYVANAFDADGRVGIEWGVTGTPETFVVDKQGIVRYKHIGPMDKTLWQNTLLPLIQRLQQS